MKLLIKNCVIKMTQQQRFLTERRQQTLSINLPQSESDWGRSYLMLDGWPQEKFWSYRHDFCLKEKRKGKKEKRRKEKKRKREKKRKEHMGRRAAPEFGAKRRRVGRSWSRFFFSVLNIPPHPTKVRSDRIPWNEAYYFGGVGWDVFCDFL